MPGHVLSAELRRLFLHILNQLWPLNAIGPAGKILHQGCKRELPSRLMALYQQRLEIGAGRVDGGGESGTTRAENYRVTHIVVVCHFL